jgi:two-component system copper resistance phosphate regulon response regulator CusR
VRLLLVEDEAAIACRVQESLEATGYTVDWARDGHEALALVREREYAVIILDLLLPGVDGWKVCESLRRRRDTTPILMLTARGALEDRLRGFEIGADDYLTKPFELPELRARVRALIRRHTVHKTRLIRIADLEIDTEARRVRRSGREVPLTPREYTLLEALALNEGRVLSREYIQERVWLDDESYSNTITVRVRQLRQKIDPPAARVPGNAVRLIHTVYGQGYVLRAPELENDEMRNGA